jgi:uncharacterized protein
MIYFIVCSIALLGSALTLFSGFGLGTLMTPIFALFFPIELAIAMTAIVHFLNNIFKLTLVGKNARWDIVRAFGIPSVLAAFLGAFLLKKMVNMPTLYTWQINEWGIQGHITLIKILIGILFILFALWEIIPVLSRISFPKKYMPFGGILSGFLGGLSGMQGALRSAFLIRVYMPKEAFIGTGVVIACLIDISRLSIYASLWSKYTQIFDYQLIMAATLSAFVGAYWGNKLMKKVTITAIQNIVATMLMIFAILMIIGVI